MVEINNDSRRLLAGYTLGRTIAYGRASKVKLAVKNNKEYAIKIFAYTDATAEAINRIFENEINIATQFDNQYIVGYHEHGHA